MRMRDEDGHHAMVAAGKAWRRIKTGQARLWSDWTMVIGPGLMKARSEAMAIAGTNQPMGRGYNTAMAGLLKEYGLDDMSETARAHMLKIMECYSEVEEWRAKQRDPGDLNHPSRVWAKFQTASRRVDERREEQASKPSLAKQTANELAAAMEDIAAKDRELADLKAHVAELESARDMQDVTAVSPADHDPASLRRRVAAWIAEAVTDRFSPDLDMWPTVILAMELKQVRAAFDIEEAFVAHLKQWGILQDDSDADDPDEMSDAALEEYRSQLDMEVCNQLLTVAANLDAFWYVCGIKHRGAMSLKRIVREAQKAASNGGFNAAELIPQKLRALADQVDSLAKDDVARALDILAEVAAGLRKIE